MSGTEVAEQKLTPEDLARWYTPTAVVALLPNNWSYDLQRSEIAHRIQAGTIRTAALRAISKGREVRCIEIKTEMWEGWSFVAYDGSAEPFWQSATYQRYLHQRGSYPDVLVQLFGVRLNPDDMATMLGEMGRNVSPTSPPGRLATAILEHQPPAAEASPPPSPAKHPGGAPPKPWWDDLWIEMFRQIWEAELQPTAMSHIAEAMLQWASDNGHALSESTAKRAARKLWAVAKPKGS